MYITRTLIGRKPCLDQAIQTRKSKLLSREFFKLNPLAVVKLLLLFYKTIIYKTIGNVARVKKSVKISQLSRVF